jgi:CheY-like chemotaxis protein
MDGVETARQVREQLDVPIIYLTAFSDEQTLQRAMATQAFGYVVKPFHPVALRRTSSSHSGSAGLDLVFTFAEQLGAEIELESQGGTKFAVRLRREDPARVPIERNAKALTRRAFRAAAVQAAD